MSLFLKRSLNLWGVGALQVVMGLLLAGSACASDWPMWRCDPGRTAASPGEIPAGLQLQWTRNYPRLEPAWPDEGRLAFDHAYHPVAADGMVFVASPRSDWVVALDAATGAEKWRFYTDGPVRFAPCFWRDRLFVASDDGHLYCLAGADGRLLWKFAGAPDAGRLAVGNKRMISSWPARGGPAVLDGRVYFAAGIWPFMGVFIHALDAETGARVWTNSGTGASWWGQPHSGAAAFGGPAPQGYLVAHSGSLLVPSSRSVPACFDLATGRLRYYHLGGNKKYGGFAVAASGGFFATFRLHATQLAGPGVRWVAASGLLGATEVAINLGTGPERAYTVRLHFAEPEADMKPGGRVFGVSLQGARVTENLDIVREASGPLRAMVMEHRGVKVTQFLKIGLHPQPKGPGTVLCGVEAVEERK